MTFAYSLRVALVLLPALFVVASFGGRPTQGVALFGLAVNFMLDSSGLDQAGLATFWATLLLTVLSIYVQGIALLSVNILNAFLLLLMGTKD
jgi:hypothetical protein